MLGTISWHFNFASTRHPAQDDERLHPKIGEDPYFTFVITLTLM
jgi:hypothetical protein